MFKLISSKNNHNVNFLHNAILKGNVYIVAYMLKFVNNKAHINELNLNQLLKMAISKETISNKIIVLLLDKLLAFDSLNSSLDVLLHLSIKANRFHLIRFLLLKGANVNYIDNDGNSLLYHVISAENFNLLELLIDHYNVDVNIPTRDGTNIIFTAIQQNNSKISGTLILAGTDINCKNKDGLYLIEVCVKKKWYLHVNYLIKKGFNVFYDDQNLFHSMCLEAINSNSTLIFHTLITNYNATVIQRFWKSLKARTRNCLSL